MLNVVDLGNDRSNNAKVVARSLHGPEDIGFLVHCNYAAVGFDNPHGNELIRNKPMVALKPPVATSKGGAKVTDTFASSSHCRD